MNARALDRGNAEIVGVHERHDDDAEDVTGRAIELRLVWLYAEYMKWSRAMLLALLSLVVSVQSWASIPCACDDHAGSAHAATTDESGHGEAHQSEGAMMVHQVPMTDSADSDTCEQIYASCGCSACSHVAGLIYPSFESFDRAVALGHGSRENYVEPPQEMAFRPPILY